MGTEKPRIFFFLNNSKHFMLQSNKHLSMLFMLISAVTEYTTCLQDNYLFVPYIHCCVRGMANPL